MNQWIKPYIIRFLGCILFCIAGQFSFAQFPTHVSNEILIQLEAEKSPYVVSTKLNQQFPGLNARAKRELSRSMQVWLFSLDPSIASLPTVLAAAQNLPEVRIAQLNHLLQNRATTPNDPLFSDQWQFLNTGASGGLADADIDADEAWDITTGGVSSFGDSVVICVIDDGFDQTHQDFGQNIWRNRQEIPNNNIDDDANGFVDDYLGWNADNNNDNISGGSAGGGHGTPVTGIVGAKGDNNLGVSGVNWDVKLMIVVGGGSEAQAIAAYSYPLEMRKLYNETQGQQGAFVVATNASWGVNYGQASNAPLWCAMYDSLGKYGVLNVAATANNNVDVDQVGDLPTTCPSEYLLAVTNTDRTDTKVTFAAFGSTSIDLGAPGEDAYTVADSNSYGPFGGTSAAAPHVAGALGLLYAATCPELMYLSLNQPDSAARYLRRLLLEGTDSLQSLQGITVSGGRLNLHNSLNLLTQNCAYGSCYAPYYLSPRLLTDSSALLGWQVYGSPDSFQVEYRVIGNGTWSSLATLDDSLLIPGLSACQGYESRVWAFCGGNSMLSESVFFTTEGCCEAPSQFSLDSTSAFEATLSFNSSLAATGWNLEFREQGTTTWIAQNGLTIPGITLFGLNTCTDYEYRVQTICDTGITTFSAIQTFRTSGCDACKSSYCSSVANSSSEEWIEDFTFDYVQNYSGNDGGYGDFTNGFVPAFQAYPGQWYYFNLTPGFNGPAWEEYVKIWIDYNLDGDFDDGGELAYDAGNYQIGPIYGNITIPNNVPNGITRMRVSMRYYVAPSPCQNSDYGEVEDYCISFNQNVNQDEELPAPTVSVYPLPAREKISIFLRGMAAGTCTVELISVCGERLSTVSQYLDEKKEHYLHIDRNGLPAGVYLLRIQQGEKTLTKRVVWID